MYDYITVNNIRTAECATQGVIPYGINNNWRLYTNIDFVWNTYYNKRESFFLAGTDTDPKFVSTLDKNNSNFERTLSLGMWEPQNEFPEL